MLQDEVIKEFFTFYKIIDKDLILHTIKTKKTFIIELFRKSGISLFCIRMK